jgi:hypothetical protein
MKSAFLTLFIFYCINSLSQSPGLSVGTQLLFQKTKCKLTNAEKENIFKQSGFLISADKKTENVESISRKYTGIEITNTFRLV